jgi:hypothetical protein
VPQVRLAGNIFNVCMALLAENGEGANMHHFEEEKRRMN